MLLPQVLLLLCGFWGSQLLTPSWRALLTSQDLFVSLDLLFFFFFFYFCWQIHAFLEGILVIFPPTPFSHPLPLPLDVFCTRIPPTLVSSFSVWPHLTTFFSEHRWETIYCNKGNLVVAPPLKKKALFCTSGWFPMVPWGGVRPPVGCVQITTAAMI